MFLFSFNAFDPGSDAVFSAFRDTTSALKAAADVTYDASVPFEPNTTTTVFETAKVSIKKCFDEYKVSWPLRL
jgi:hypothetical protein